MKKIRKILVSVMILLLLFSLVSCFEPDTDSKPPDVTTVTVKQTTKPVSVTSAAVTTVPSTSKVTEITVAATSEPDNESGYNQAEYEYDKLGRLVKVKYDDLNYIEYEYDANGNINKITKTENGKKISNSQNK